MILRTILNIIGTAMEFPAMKRCECAGKAFEEVARVVALEGPVDLDQIIRGSGCAQLCTACRPDLERYLRQLAISGLATATGR